MVLIAIPLIVLLAVFVAYGQAALTRSVSGGFIGWLAKTALASTVIGPTLVNAVLKLSSHVTHALGAHFREIEHQGAAWIGALASYVNLVGEKTLLWPFELTRFAYWLLRTEIPRLIAALPHAAARVVHAVTTRVTRVERTVVKLPKLSRAQAKALVGAAVAVYVGPYLSPLRWLRQHFHALTAVLPHAIPIHWGQTITGIRKRLRRLERALPGTAAFAAAVAVALGRLGLGWVRCNNVRRIGRELCGLSPRTITDLLGLFADVLILSNICRVFTVLEEGLGFIQPEITAFIGGVGAWSCYGDTERPPRLVVPSLDLPASSGVHGLPV